MDLPSIYRRFLLRLESDRKLARNFGQKERQWLPQGYLAHKKLPPTPQDFRRALGVGLLQGPRERLFLMSEVHTPHSEIPDSYGVSPDFRRPLVQIESWNFC